MLYFYIAVFSNKKHYTTLQTHVLLFFRNFSELFQFPPSTRRGGAKNGPPCSKLNMVSFHIPVQFKTKQKNTALPHSFCPMERGRGGVGGGEPKTGQTVSSYRCYIFHTAVLLQQKKRLQTHVVVCFFVIIQSYFRFLFLPPGGDQKRSPP